MKEAGDVIHAIDSGRISLADVRADLSELVAGTKEGRKSSEEVTLFKSVGFTLQDVYASNYVFEKPSVS